MLDHFILSLLFITKARRLGDRDKQPRKRRASNKQSQILDKLRGYSVAAVTPADSGNYIFMPDGEFRKIRYSHEYFIKQFIHPSGKLAPMLKLGVGRTISHGGGIAIQTDKLTDEQKKELKLLVRALPVHLEGDVWGKRSFFLNPDSSEYSINSALARF